MPYLAFQRAPQCAVVIYEYLLILTCRLSFLRIAYDDQVYVDDRTIDSHIKRLRKKFKSVDDAFDMIETLYGVGYRFKEA